MLVAIIGAGFTGLAAAKNCIEEGLEPIVFERDSAVGGLWRYKPDDVSGPGVMKNTVPSFSKHRMGFTDFPMPDDCPLFPTADWMVSFIESYAKQFNLLPKIRFNSAVTSVDFAPADEGVKFAVKYKSSENSIGEEQAIVVDRVVVATGACTLPYTPAVEGIERFGGPVVHAGQFRSGDPYHGKNVLIVGSRISAADICTELDKAGAGRIYMTHRRGVQILPRMWGGKPIDCLQTRRTAYLQAFLEKMIPYSSGTFQEIYVNVVRSTTFKYKKEWGFTPAPDTRAAPPTISDDIYPLLMAGRVGESAVRSVGAYRADLHAEPIPPIANVMSDNSVVLTDGRELHSIDAIIFATGYTNDPAKSAPLSQAVLQRMGYDAAKPAEFPRFRYTLTAQLPELLILSQVYAPTGIAPLSDIQTMWVASVWSGNVKLPGLEKIMKQSRKEAKYLTGLKKYGKVTAGFIPVDVVHALAAEAGCDDSHTTLWSWEGWKWWWNNRALSSLVMDGPDLPASHRLRGRKKWDGAADVIWKANGKVPPKKA
ncbi:FAD/NAD(P)-binding domain-containing protein [Clavulina sp. PMI_390]|nr:FAD/NAD(P)-binding domain-containing protein [Clavulina sp. PMI_390]